MLDVAHHAVCSAAAPLASCIQVGAAGRGAGHSLDLSSSIMDRALLHTGACTIENKGASSCPHLGKNL